MAVQCTEDFLRQYPALTISVCLWSVSLSALSLAFSSLLSSYPNQIVREKAAIPRDRCSEGQSSALFCDPLVNLPCERLLETSLRGMFAWLSTLQ